MTPGEENADAGASAVGVRSLFRCCRDFPGSRSFGSGCATPWPLSSSRVAPSARTPLRVRVRRRDVRIVVSSAGSTPVVAIARSAGSSGVPGDRHHRPDGRRRRLRAHAPGLRPWRFLLGSVCPCRPRGVGRFVPWPTPFRSIALAGRLAAPDLVQGRRRVTPGDCVDSSWHSHVLSERVLDADAVSFPQLEVPVRLALDVQGRGAATSDRAFVAVRALALPSGEGPIRPAGGCRRPASRSLACAGAPPRLP